MEYCSATAISREQRIELDYLAYNAFTINTLPVDAKKGYFVHITRDNDFVADGIISDVRPEKNKQKISIRPIQALFDADVFYSEVTDCIQWIANNITEQFITNSDATQNRPIDLTFTMASESLPITEDIDPDSTEALNILSIIQNALKTYSVYTNCWIDMESLRIKCDISQITDTQTVEADLENVLDVSVTLGDSYGSFNKVIIKKYHYIENPEDPEGDPAYEELGFEKYYLHNDGTIDKTDADRIFPVFWKLASIEFGDNDSDLEYYTIEEITASTWNGYSNSTKNTKKEDYKEDFLRNENYKWQTYTIEQIGQDTWDSYDDTQQKNAKESYKNAFLTTVDASWTEYTRGRCGSAVWDSYSESTRKSKKDQYRHDYTQLVEEAWNEAADKKAFEILNPQQYDQEIICSYEINDYIVHPMDMVIGTVVTVHYKGIEYYSILAARTIENNIVTLTFGSVRTELTKKLSMEKVEGSVSSGGSGGGGSRSGVKGADGVGIATVIQTTTSTADQGENIITVTKTDNSWSTFTVRNGSKGSQGNPGGFGTPQASATTLSEGQPATVNITSSGPDSAKIFNFEFGLPRGETGTAAGFGTPTASVTSLPSESSPTASVSASGSDTSKIFAFNFGIPKGDPLRFEDLTREQIEELQEGISGFGGVEMHGVDLTVAGWSNNSQSVTVSSYAISSSDYLSIPQIATAEAYTEAGVLLSSAVIGSNNTVTFTFTCTTVPSTTVSTTVLVSTSAIKSGGLTQVQSDWNEIDATDPAYILNKPTIPVGLPSGGNAGQFLVKSSSTDYDVEWTTIPNAVGNYF